MARRARHNLSFSRLFSGDAGQILPCGVVEGLPGDVMSHQTQAFIRLSPLAAPAMQAMSAKVFTMFVPHRLTMGQKEWEDFITGGSDGRDVSTIPTIATTGTKGDLLDYLGLPAVSGVNVSALPLRAVNLCYNEWFRDQDLVPTERALEDTTVPRAAWDKDYFTTARPFAQKGDEITLPLGTEAPVRGIGKTTNTWFGSNSVYESGATQRTYDSSAIIQLTDPNGNFAVEEDPNNAGFPNIVADLSQATAATINALRRAFALQRFAENRARFGSRYPELLRAWGVRPLDGRLQRPELLSVSSGQVGISEVMQTGPDPQADPRFGVGDMYGHGVALTSGRPARYRLSEHGYVVSMLVVRPRPMYADGIERHFLRQTREDFWQPELQFIGQEPVYGNEVYAQPGADEVFGWVDRYESYRYQRSGVAADFRDTLNYWHQARQFQARPALNQTFVECTPSKRIYNVQSEDPLWVTVQHRIRAKRLVTADRRPRVL